MCGETRIPRDMCVGNTLPGETYITVTAVLEGFLRFPETTQDFPSTTGAPFFGYNISRGIHSGLNSGGNWPLSLLEVKEM